MLADKFGRKINYLRLAVTDRCNLRCTYCMPEQGLNWLSRTELMTTVEMKRLCRIFTEMGIEKIRITGGEPFIRKDLISFLEQIEGLPGLNEIAITTNGLLTKEHIPKLKSLGIKSVNLSLDTLDPDVFFNITRRHELDRVLQTLYALVAHNFDVKINTVVMNEKNIDDIIPLVNLTHSLPVSVRFIEEMPFNGNNNNISLAWTAANIVEHIQQYFPSMQKIADPVHSTASLYSIPGHLGNVGVIAAYTRSFCGECNRLRLTPTGILRTCLYQADGISLKEAMRTGQTDIQIKEIIRQAVMDKPKDGHQAEKLSVSLSQVHQSMATIGG